MVTTNLKVAGGTWSLNPAITRPTKHRRRARNSNECNNGTRTVCGGAGSKRKSIGVKILTNPSQNTKTRGGARNSISGPQMEENNKT